MKSALNKNIISVAIEADKYVFQSYSSGIFNSTKCGTNLDHATNVVGWGTKSGTDYWIMRNSWEPSSSLPLNLPLGSSLCSAPIVCQKEFPIWLPHCPTWTWMISLTILN